MYASAREYIGEYRAGAYDVVLAALQNVPIPDERELSWEQILDMKQDRQSQIKLRRLKHWLDAEMIGRTPQYIADEIAIRLHDYQNALRKHGVATILGSLQTAIDAKVVTGGALAVASLSFATSPTAALVAGGGIVVGSAALHIARAVLDVDEKRDATHPEIAFVAEIEKRGSAAG